MPVGPASAVADAILDTIIGAGVHVQLHTADPGAAGTTAACTGTNASTRKNAGDSVPSAGVANFDESALSWPTWDGGSVNVTHITLWSAVTAGTFRQSLALTSPVAMVNGGTFVLDTLQLTCNKAS
jgi:hypothetical protein